MPDNGQPADGFTRVRAFTIHVFTATGAGLAFLALVFATGGHWAAMFFTFGLALIVAGIACRRCPVPRPQSVAD